MKKKEIAELYLKRLLKHHDRTIDGKFYALSRIDLLVISISSGGIYIIFELIKFFNSVPSQLVPKTIPDLLLVKLSGCAFTLAIVVNFLSQWTGYKANKFELESNEIAIEEEKKRKVDEKRKNYIDCKVDLYNKFTSWLNGVSTLLMVIGIVLLAVFNFFIF